MVDASDFSFLGCWYVESPMPGWPAGRGVGILPVPAGENCLGWAISVAWAAGAAWGGGGAC